MDRDTQEIIMNQLLNHINDFDEDLIIKLKDKIDNTIEEEFSEEAKEDKFLELFRLVREKLDKLISCQKDCPYDIWQFAWERLFGKDGYIDRAYKLHPFNTDIVDSSYQDEVWWIMSNWEDSCKAIVERRNKEKTWQEL